LDVSLAALLRRLAATEQTLNLANNSLGFMELEGRVRIQFPKIDKYSLSKYF